MAGLTLLGAGAIAVGLAFGWPVAGVAAGVGLCFSK